MSRKFWVTKFALLTALAIFSMAQPSQASAENISFAIDPATLPDTNMDGFVNDMDLAPVGTDGVIFTFMPVDNLVGLPKFDLHALHGLRFGGGGGSTLEFDFSVSEDVSLQSYTLSSTGGFLGNPLFNISEGATVLSMDNGADMAGMTLAFEGGPLELTAGTTYTFNTTVFGAAIQSHFNSWEYERTNTIPEPTAAGLLALSSVAVVFRRRR